MRKILSKQEFEVIVEGQIYLVDFDYEENYYRNHSADRYQEPEDITTSEILTIGDVVTYDDDHNNKIVYALEDLPKEHQNCILSAVEGECRLG